MGYLVSTQDFIKDWEQLDTLPELNHFIAQHLSAITEETVQQMKARANELSYSEVKRAVRLVESLHYAAELSGQPLYRAIAKMAMGNAARWQGQQQLALAFYEEAQALALAAGNELEAARSQIGKVGALVVLGEYQKAIETGELTRKILLAYAQLEAAVNLDFSLGVCYRKLANYEQALTVYNRAIALLNQFKEYGLECSAKNQQNLLAMACFNISLVLADLNQYREALQKADEAAEAQRKLGNAVQLSIIQESSAYYNLQLGNYNKALRLLNEAREVFVTNNMAYYLLHCDLYSIQCYLELNGFDRAVERCTSLIERLELEKQAGTIEAGKANHFLGVALTRQGCYPEAQTAFEKARQILTKIGSGLYATNPALDQAELHYRQGEYSLAEKLAEEAGRVFQEQGLPVDSARCTLLMSRIRLGQARLVEARELVGQALAAIQTAQVPGLLYQALLLQAEVAEAQGDPVCALELYRSSLAALEELRGRIAAESRATFIEDKAAAYQGAVALSLEAGQWAEALELVERGKSRGLVDLLVGELDVRVRVRAEADRGLVAELERWRARRNELVSQVSNSRFQVPASNTRSPAVLANHLELETRNQKLLLFQIRECEEQIKALVERLQVCNAAYAEDVVIQPPATRIATEYLERDSVLVEYYICRGEVLAFVVNSGRVEVVRHLLTEKELNRQLSLLRLNLNSVAQFLAESGLTPEQRQVRLQNLNRNAGGLFQKFYRQLVAPLAEHLAGYRRLLIVPHGLLHYLPFHAFQNSASNAYLLEEWEEISYLPSGSLLKFCQQRGERPAGEHGGGTLVMGFSANGDLAYCVKEAQDVANQVAALGDCRLYLEDKASLARFETEAGQCRVLHLATHGSFRQDNPLFSSLLLADGELTAQDLFNRELKASLVTFSACETGLGKLGGGDELLGLSRACLYAGASSLLLSLWRVEDKSVARLMQAFYRHLISGQRKATALREAQLELLHDENYYHPFFWAAFILIGHAGLL